MTSRKETSYDKLSFDFPVWEKTKENTDRQTFLKVHISRLDGRAAFQMYQDSTKNVRSIAVY